MIYLRYGDRLPSVGVIQRLINECIDTDDRFAQIPKLAEDGIFGRNTLKAVKATQVILTVKPPNGVFAPSTWRALARHRKCKIVDVTDLALETLLQKKGQRVVREELIAKYLRKHPKKSKGQAERVADRSIRKYQNEIRDCRDQHNRFVAHGGEPIGITSKEDVFGTISRGLDARSSDGSRVVMLRFTGHGSPASQGVFGSLFGAVSIDADTLSFDDDDSIEELIDTVMLSGMTMPMAKFGCVELHGCNVAKRRLVGRGRNRVLLNGPAYVQSFADLVGRPVTGSTIGDYFGTLQLDTRYEGAVVTGVPGGGTVERWLRVN